LIYFSWILTKGRSATNKGAVYVVHDFAHLLFLGVILHGSEVIQGISRGLNLVSMVLKSIVAIKKRNGIYMKFAVLFAEVVANC